MVDGYRPTRDDGDINPNTKVCELSQRGRKIGRPGKEDGAMVSTSLESIQYIRIPSKVFDT